MQSYAIALDIITFALKGLTAGFVLHVLCRMLWLSFSGISKFYPDNFGKYYERSALARIGLPDFKETMRYFDNLAGLVFSISSLLLGLLVSISLWMVYLVSIGTSHLPWQIKIWLWPGLQLISIPYLFNFLTLHRLSRTRFYRWYMPINNFLSVITLSIVYRRLTMGLFANISGKVIGVFILVLTVGIFYSTNMFRLKEKFASDMLGRSTMITDQLAPNSFMYQDENLSNDVPPVIEIPSYIQEGNLLTAKLLHMVQIEEMIWESIPLDSTSYDDLPRQEKFNLVSEFYNFYLDGDRIDVNFQPLNQDGYTQLRFIVDLQEVSKGEHVLQVNVDQPIRNISFFTIDHPTIKDEYIYAEVSFYKASNN